MKRTTPSASWCSGWAEYIVDQPVNNHQLVVGVSCRIAGLPNIEHALLDTGAQWSLVGGELAELMAEFAEDLDQPIPYSTRFGRIEARAYRASVVLVASSGEDLEVEATVALAPDFRGPLVLGYRGFLEKVRVALVPATSQGETDWFGFGG